MDTVPKPTAVDEILAKTLLVFVPKSVRPNHLTAVRFVSIPVIFWLFYIGLYAWGSIFFCLSAFTDVLDGALARTRNQCTEWGKLYDPLADKLLVIVVGGVLIVRFLNLYIFLAVAFIDILIILLSGYRKIVHNKIVGAHMTGKIKMILQSLGIFGLVLQALFGWEELTPILFGMFYGAIGFGFASLVVYKRS